MSKHTSVIMSAMGGVAARAESVYLIYSNDWVLGHKEGTRIHLQQHHPVPHGCPFSMKI